MIKSRTSNGGYGNYVDVQHPGGYVTRYAHMAASGWYAPGTKVLRGQQIGVVGNTGNSAAYHLHFEVWLNGKVYSQINQGFTCLSNVTRGGTIPLFFPGLGASDSAGIDTADFTGNGKADLLVVAGNGDLRLRTGNGRSGLAGPTTLFGGGWGTPDGTSPTRTSTETAMRTSSWRAPTAPWSSTPGTVPAASAQRPPREPGGTECVTSHPVRISPGMDGRTSSGCPRPGPS